jgi:hypothetical protein
MANKNNTIPPVPVQTPIIDNTGRSTVPWTMWFQNIFDTINNGINGNSGGGSGGGGWGNINLNAIAPLYFNKTTNTLSISLATSSTAGYLSFTDWNIFNDKEPAISIGANNQFWRGDKTFQQIQQSDIFGLMATDSPAFNSVIFTQPQGQPPFVVNSNTLVSDLNAEYLNGASLTDDTTLNESSSVLVPTENAVKSYVDTITSYVQLKLYFTNLISDI